jgi:hypothetical protein
MKTYLFIISLAIVSLASCKKENDSNTEKSAITDSNLIGSWINPDYSDTIISFGKSDSLKTSDYGFTFFENGEFIERANAGWCGTPPISYADFHGTWEMTDSIVTIEVDYWGGNATYKWRVLSLTNNALKIDVVEQNYNNTLGY